MPGAQRALDARLDLGGGLLGERGWPASVDTARRRPALGQEGVGDALRERERPCLSGAGRHEQRPSTCSMFALAGRAGIQVQVPASSRRRARGRSCTGPAARVGGQMQPRPARGAALPKPSSTASTSSPNDETPSAPAWPALPAPQASAVDARHVGSPTAVWSKAPGDAPVAVRTTRRAPPRRRAQQAAAHRAYTSVCTLCGSTAPPAVVGRRCRISEQRERPLVVDNHGLAASVHVDAVHAAAQQASCVRERLARAEIELEEGRETPAEQFAVEEHERAFLPGHVRRARRPCAGSTG